MTDDTFTTTRHFRASRIRVWEAWTQGPLLARWIAPAGTTMTVLRCEVAPGGMLHFRMDLPGAAPSWARFVYREVDPPHRLAWLHAFADAEAELAPAPFPGDWPLEMLTTAVFLEEGEGTRVTLTMAAVQGSAAERAGFRAGFPSMAQGWGGSFEALDRLLG